MLHQPRVPPTGQRQAVEIAIKWKEVLAQKTAFLKILEKTTGHSTEKLDKVRPRLFICTLFGSRRQTYSRFRLCWPVRRAAPCDPA